MSKCLLKYVIMRDPNLLMRWSKIKLLNVKGLISKALDVSNSKYGIMMHYLKALQVSNGRTR